MSGTVRDLSLGGAFVETSERPAFGERVDVELSKPGQSCTLRVSGVVRWCSDLGFGMQFGLLGARETHGLVQLLGELRERPEVDGGRASGF